MQTAANVLEDAVTDGDILTFARESRTAADAAEVNVLRAALAWAHSHGTAHLDDAATYLERDHLGYTDTGLPLGGQGCPLVSEFSVAELATALGMSTEAGKTLLGHALELAHRLPRVWAQVTAGHVQAWRARRIADQTLPLTADAAGFVDTHIAHVAATTGPRQVQRLVDEAIARYMPAEADRIRDDAADGRHVWIDTDAISFTGTAQIEGVLDLPDALDLDRALNHGAATLKQLGVTGDRDVRRSLALGELARQTHCGDQQLGFGGDGFDSASPRGSAGSTTEGDPSVVEPADRPSVVEPAEPQRGRVETTPPQTPRRTREVVLYIHLSHDALLDETVDTECARVTGRGLGAGALVTADTVRAWLGATDHPSPGPDLTISVRPVIDLAEQVHTDAYEVTDRQREVLELRDHTCVFPWCTRRARSADCDHIHNWSTTSPTCTCNLAPLCRTHHRLKTHGHGHTRWTYEQTSPGMFVWTSPHGATFLRDHTGTRPVHPSPPRPRD